MSLPPAHKCLHAAYAFVLSHERYRGRWHSIRTLQSIGNEFSPADLVLNHFTAANAFSIKGQDRYAEYYFNTNLLEETGSPEGTILAIRRIQKRNKKDGFFTVVGCFHCDNVLSEETARRLDGGDTFGRASIRADDAFNLPSRITRDLKSYADAAQKKGRKYFKKASEYTPTPQQRTRRQRPPSSQRPRSAGSAVHVTKKRRPNTADSAASNLATPTPLTPTLHKTNKELAVDLKASLQADIDEQHNLERQIKAAIKKIKGLKSLEKKILRADDLQRKIQSDLDELTRLDRQQYCIDDVEDAYEMQYYLDEQKAGQINIFKQREIIFTSQLERAVFHENEEQQLESNEAIQPSPPPAAISEEEKRPKLVVDANDDDSPKKKKRKRAGRKTYASRNRKCRFVFDKAHGCWIPKWMMITGSGQSTLNTQMLEVFKRFKKLFSGKQTRFSARAKRTISVSTLAAAGASD